MKSLLLLPLIVALGVCAAGCGHVDRRGGSTSRTSKASRYGYFEGDADSDDLEHPHLDPDDSHVRGYGHEAGVGERQAVSTLVKRYYAAAAVGAGAQACSLIYSRIAASTNFANFVPEAYTQVSQSSLFHDKTCAQVESVLFELAHKQLAAGAPTVAVISLRVKGSYGIALLAFKGMPERQIAVEREDGRWKIDALLSSEIP